MKSLLLLLALQFQVIIDVSDRKLYLYKEGELIKTYPVAVPAQPLRKTLEGELRRIELDPWWFPTENIRREYYERTGKVLPKAIPPGDPRNAMGKAKFIIDFKNTNEPIRVHGTNDERSIGRAVTHGCIRLRNNDILEIIEIIKDGKTIVIIQP